MKTTISTIIVSVLFSSSIAFGAPFIDNGDNTVTDTATGMTWVKYAETGVTWAEADDYCANLELAGYQWALPGGRDLKASGPFDAAGNPIEFSWELEFTRNNDGVQSWVYQDSTDSTFAVGNSFIGAALCITDGTAKAPAVATSFEIPFDMLLKVESVSDIAEIDIYKNNEFVVGFNSKYVTELPVGDMLTGDVVSVAINGVMAEIVSVEVLDVYPWFRAVVGNDIVVTLVDPPADPVVETVYVTEYVDTVCEYDAYDIETAYQDGAASVTCDDGNNGHGNDDDHDDDSNPGRGNKKHHRN